MNPSISHPLLGAHMSIAGGAYKAILLGESIGCTAIQIFTASNRQWSFKIFSDEDIQKFNETKAKSSIKMIVSHASYLINLGSTNKITVEKSIKAITAELVRGNQLSLPYLIVHAGSNNELNKEKSMDFFSENLDLVLENTEGSCKILLENSAGQGSSLGSNFDELAYMHKKLKHKKRVGFCFDTCHAFAAGYDFTTSKQYHAMWDDFDKKLGLENLHVIHLNDSAKSLGSHVDRHQNIGKGKIGLEAFSLIINDKKFVSIPKILETPTEKDLSDFKTDLETVQSLIKTF